MGWLWRSGEYSDQGKYYILFYTVAIKSQWQLKKDHKDKIKEVNKDDYNYVLT